MIDISHLLVLSQPELLQRQVRTAMEGGENGWSWPRWLDALL